MAEEIRVRHEIDLGQLERFEKALKDVKGSVGSTSKITNELNKQVKAQGEKNKLEKEEVGIVGKLLAEQKKLRAEQKVTQDPKRLKQINKELYKVGTQLKKNKDTTATWAKALGSFGFKFNALANAVNRVTSAITRGFNVAMRNAVKAITEFESGMAAVQAISGATAEEFKKLRQDAIRLGGATIFTARQVSELQVNYAKLGFSTQEILNATEATLALAAATDEGLAPSALVAGSIIRAFGLDAAETGRVVDVMAKSFTSSALNLENFTEAMKFLAPVAKQAGLTLEETTSILAVLADTGLKGSLAGTSLRNIFLRMVDPASALAKRFGFTVRTGEELVIALNKLKSEGIDLAEALELTNLRAVTAFSTLAEQGPKLTKLTKQFNEAAGSAQKMADIRMDTLQGSVTILKSAWEGFIISFESGEGTLTRGVRGMVDRLTGFVNKMKALNDTSSDSESIIRSVFGELQNELDILRVGNFDYEDRVEIIGELNTKYGTYLPNLIDEKITVSEILDLQRLLNQEMLGRILVLQYEADIKRELELQTGLAKGLVEIEKDRAKAKLEVVTVSAEVLEKEKLFRNLLEDTNKALIDNSQERMDELLTDYEKAAENLGLVFADILKRFRITTKEIVKEPRETGIIITDEPQDITKAILLLAKQELKIAEWASKERLEIEKSRLAIEEKDDEIRLQKIQEFADEELRIRILAKIKYLELTKLINKDESESIQKNIDFLKASIGNIGDGIDSSKPEKGPYEGLANHAKRTSDFVINQLEAINNAEIRLNNDRISRMDQHISELQRALDEEYELRREGKANRVALLEEEIRIEQERRERAYREQERLEKKKRILQTAAQLSNMLTSATNIWQWATAATGPLAVPIAIAAIAAMVGSWIATIGNIGSSIPKFAEGGWVDGEPHSRGGVMLNAEGGEFIMNKLAARENADALEAMNNGDMWDKPIYKRIIKVDNKESERLLGELVKQGNERTQDFGGYIEYKRGNTIYRIKK